MGHEKSSLFGQWRAPFHVVSITLLTLLLPLSFILLARLSLLNAVSDEIPPTSSSSLQRLLWPLKSFDYPFIYSTVSTLSVATLFYGLTSGRSSVALADDSSLGFAWILLICLQLFVGLGIEGTVAVNSDWYALFSFEETSFWVRVGLFLGLHDVMMFWSKTFVVPVVDDTVYGRPMEETWVVRVVVSVAFGGVWWMSLRNEIDLLVFLAEIKKDVKLNSIADFVAWWLYYLIVMIGIVRMVKILVGVGSALILGRKRRAKEVVSDCEYVGFSDDVEV